MAASLALTGLMMQVAPSALAVNPFENVDGVNSNDATKIYDDLNDLVEIVIGIGGFWVIICIIFSAIVLSGSNGNAQRRTLGLSGLAFALLGGWIMFKAHTIAGWILNFG